LGRYSPALAGFLGDGTTFPGSSSSNQSISSICGDLTAIGFSYSNVCSSTLYSLSGITWNNRQESDCSERLVFGTNNAKLAERYYYRMFRDSEYNPPALIKTLM